MICEGALAYLNDTIQWRKTYHDTTPTQYLTDKINWHNDRMDSMRKFTAGITCTVTNSTDNVYRQDNDLPSTLDNIQKKLIDRLGGFVGLAGWLSARDRRQHDDGEWRGKIDAKLDIVCTMRKDVDRHSGDISEIKEWVVAVEQSAKSAHHRIDRIEEDNHEE